MTIKELKEMINLMQEHGLTELEIEKNGFKIRLKKGVSGAIVREESVVALSSASQEKPGGSVAVKEADAAGVMVIRSPMVGTFYAAAAPGAAPFIQAGSAIEVGQVVCIIEAMKLMNEIKSEVRGKVAQVLVNNGDPVEFGQPIFVLE